MMCVGTIMVVVGLILAHTSIADGSPPTVDTVASVPETQVISGAPQQLSFPFLLVLHDDANNVTCWALVPVTGVGGLDCMADAEFTQRVQR